MMQAPVIMNASFQRIALIDDFISFIWSARYWDCGDFQLCVDANASYVSMLQYGNYIVRDDDDYMGIIEKISISRNNDQHEVLKVSGRFLSSILARRIVANQTTVSGSVSACVNRLIKDAVTSPALSRRRISAFTVDSHSITSTMSAQYTGKNLLEVISDICKAAGCGFKTTYDNGQFHFALYEGSDRTYNQSALPWVIFSDKYDNLLAYDYQENYSGLVTDVLTAGEGEGTARKMAWVNTSSGGLAQYESFNDQRGITTNGGSIANADYLKMLQASGRTKLTQYTQAFAGSVDFENVKYKEDIFLGDLCVIENSTWGIRVNARLVEIIESISETGEYTIVPSFGI